MWKVLVPLVVLVVILLFQLQMTESFTTSSTTTTGTDASGSTVDASGNPIDASGNTTTTTAAKETITLSLSDLVALFRSSTNVPSSSVKIMPPPVSTPTNEELYNKIRPQLLSEIRGAMKTELAGAPYMPSEPLPCDSPISDAAAQGAEYQNALKDYIKKDEIPCYGCSL